MLSIPTLYALHLRRRSGHAALRHAVAATLLGSLLALPVTLSSATAQTRDTDKKQSAPQRPAAKPASAPAKPADRKTPDTKPADAKPAVAKPADTKPADAKPAVTAAAATTAAAAAAAAVPSLQLGLFSRESDAWWAWESLQRREPELTKGLSATVSFLDGKSEAGGAVLRATVPGGTDPQRLCRRIVGAGFGCLIVDPPVGAATVAKADPPQGGSAATAAAPVPSPAPGGNAATPAMTAAHVPTVTVPVTAAPPPVPAPAASVPAAQAPATQAPAAPAPVTQTAMAAAPAAPSVLAPIGSAVAAPLVPPPSAAKAVAPVEGTVIYTEEDARTMADIEQHSRRKGRLRSVMPDSRLDVMPATLKLEAWNLCALTFDDGPHRTVTRQVLDVLNREGVRATYFPVGRVAQNQGDLIRDFIAAGHEIGNHSLTHSDLRVMGADGQRYEIAETNRILRSFGANPVLFRPPYGRYSDELLAIAREERMGSVLWTVDTRDWKVRDADKIVQHIKTAGGTGNVFLMHSTYPTTAQALPRVIAELRAKGCEFVTLSEWLERMRVLAMPKIVNAGMPAPAGVPAGAPIPAGAPAPAARN